MAFSCFKPHVFTEDLAIAMDIILELNHVDFFFDRNLVLHIQLLLVQLPKTSNPYHVMMLSKRGAQGFSNAATETNMT